jgi:hypothetical protein
LKDIGTTFRFNTAMKVISVFPLGSALDAEERFRNETGCCAAREAIDDARESSAISANFFMTSLLALSR